MARYLELLPTLYERELQRELALQHRHDQPALERGELSALPPPVREFVAASGCLDRSHPTNARIVWRSMHLRRAPDAPWLPVECEQVSFFRAPTRLALMRSSLAGLLPFSGYDRYRDARARMFVNVAGVLPLRRVYGPPIDQSALVTYLAEAMLLPALFVDPRLHWTALDAGSARASLRDGSSCVSGVFHFDPAQDWVRFESEDRWRDDRTPYRQRWSAEARCFDWHKGLRVPSFASAHWHTEQGPFPYVQAQLESINYDIHDPRVMVAPRLLALARRWRTARIAPAWLPTIRRP